MASSTMVRDDDRVKNEGESRDPLSISPDVKASLNILIVDDDRTLREGCASVLQMDGYNVTTLGRGDEARRRPLSICVRRRCGAKALRGRAFEDGHFGSPCWIG